MQLSRAISMLLLGLLVLMGQVASLRSGLAGRAAESCVVVEDEALAAETDVEERCPCCTPLNSCGCGMEQAPAAPRPAPVPLRLAGGEVQIKMLLPEPSGVPVRFGVAAPGMAGAAWRGESVPALVPSRARLCVRLT